MHGIYLYFFLLMLLPWQVEMQEELGAVVAAMAEVGELIDEGDPTS